MDKWFEVDQQEAWSEYSEHSIFVEHPRLDIRLSEVNKYSGFNRIIYYNFVSIVRSAQSIGKPLERSRRTLASTEGLSAIRAEQYLTVCVADGTIAPSNKE